MGIVIFGAGGHAKVVIDIIRSMALAEKITVPLIRLLDDNLQVGTKINSCEVVGKVSDCHKLNENNKFIIGIGNNEIREQIAKQYDLPYFTAIHPNVIVGSNIKIGSGSVLMGGVVINSESNIGNHCIINTGATIDHEDMIEDYVHISPGVHIGGNVTIGRKTWVGIGSSIINGICIGSGSVIGAGAVVIKDIPDGSTAVGIPARLI